METKQGLNSASLRGDVFRRLVEIAAAQIAEQEANRQQAQSEANSHVGAMESRYDTFKEDAQYLSAGYEQRIRMLSKQQTRLSVMSKEERIRPTLTEGALIEVIDASENLNCLVIAEIALDEKYAPKGRIEAGGKEWIVATPKSEEGMALLGLHEAYMEEIRYLAERQGGIEMARQVRPILDLLRAAVIEADVIAALPPTKAMQVGVKLENAVKGLVKKGRGTTKERLKDAGDGLLWRLRGEPALESETRQSHKPYWTQIEEEMKVIILRLSERNRERVKEWTQRLEIAVKQGGREVIQAAPTQRKPMTSEKALEWWLNGLKRAIGTKPAAQAFKKASVKLRKTLERHSGFRGETEAGNEMPYWMQIEREIDKRVMKGDENTLKKEYEAVTAQRAALERKGPPSIGSEITINKKGQEQKYRVVWVG